MDILTAFSQFGAQGLMIGYLVWREKTIADRRALVDEKRAEVDKTLASALTALTLTVQGLEGRLK